LILFTLQLFKKVVQIYLLEKGKTKNYCDLAQPFLKVDWFGSTFLKGGMVWLNLF